MYIEPSGLRTMLASIIAHHENEEFEVPKPQRQRLAELVQVKSARDTAAQKKQWAEAYRQGRQLEALARRYIIDFFPTEAEYRILHAEPLA